MKLTRHQTDKGARWALDEKFLPANLTLDVLLELSKSQLATTLKSLVSSELATGALLAPLEDRHEVWACGVTYLRSRDARKEESEVADVYELVYDAERPEVFFKSLGWRSVGDGGDVRIRRDSSWNVPEPEITLVINALGEIVGYTVGNDMSSRSIEGENPLYLPQAKMYDGACALGAGIVLTDVEVMRGLSMSLEITRNGETIFSGESSVSQMKRSLEELAACVGQEMTFPHGVFLMTGTSLVPPDDFTLELGDEIQMQIGEMKLNNRVA